MQQFSKFINKPGKNSLFIIGVLNGFLPCGLVYMAIAGAYSNYDIVNAMIFMLFFGLGTFPMMLSISFFGKHLKNKINVRKMFPFIAFIMGVLFIVRGLELNIPYLSPLFKKNNFENQEIQCK